jgi:hypothetical protein
MDFSFLKLYNSIEESLVDERLKNIQIRQYEAIQLSPDESYMQKTNYEGGLSFAGEFEARVVGLCDTELKVITNNVFIEEYIDYNGNTQNNIEIIGIGEDFHGRNVCIKITHPPSNRSYYTRPIKITNKRIDKTYRFDYINNGNLLDIDYESSLKYQSIRLKCEYKLPDNKTEVGEYYQLSTGNSISTRLLTNIKDTYFCENADYFIFLRLQKLFSHDTIYIDNKRITTNPVVNVDSRQGKSNLMNLNFEASVNDRDTYTYNYQIFEGLQPIFFEPHGNYITGTTFTKFEVTWNVPIEINTGTITVYDGTTFIDSFNEGSMSVFQENKLRVDIAGSVIQNPANSTYHIHVTAGLVSALTDTNEAIEDTETWCFTLADADFNGSDFNNQDFFTD